MHELARRILTEAGGNQTSVVFAPIGQNPLASNRKLHMCAFLIGMYAIGLHNQVCPSWKSRTYSTHVSWINLQAAELGLMAIEVVRETWPTHLTPSEAAGLADKAGQSRDPAVVEEAARLALSVLPYAYTLSAAETQRALLQCNEQGASLLESACRAVEEAANKEPSTPVINPSSTSTYQLLMRNSPTTSTFIHLTRLHIFKVIHHQHKLPRRLIVALFPLLMKWGVYIKVSLPHNCLAIVSELMLDQRRFRVS
ncbi:hypothetical protein KIN20_003312 [Parelaphostrongylus tenuis]|uniref:Uncharacterized protein n=1 Tax=Parelaphostrongylus tenuis TaxID=148309 RepID=A0AAD5MPR6_PARTN|nr:hypothetical protein KIN20_003312 [Parelaphostrongylus tenuis]